MPALFLSILLAHTALLPAEPVSRHADHPAVGSYRYTSKPLVNAYDLLSGGAIQNRLTDELERNYYGVRNRLRGRDPKSGITVYARDVSHVTPGKVVVYLTDGSHIEADFGGTPPAAHIVAGSGVDSHGNRLPSRWGQISDGSRGRSYDFSGPGNPHDQRDFERFVSAFQVKFAGHGKHVHCVSTTQQTIVCHRKKA